MVGARKLKHIAHKDILMKEKTYTLVRMGKEFVRHVNELVTAVPE